jgi:hypothetical protein
MHFCLRSCWAYSAGFLRWQSSQIRTARLDPNIAFARLRGLHGLRSTVSLAWEFRKKSREPSEAMAHQPSTKKAPKQSSARVTTGIFYAGKFSNADAKKVSLQRIVHVSISETPTENGLMQTEFVGSFEMKIVC